MASFKPKPNTPPGEFTFVVSSHCPLCREAMSNFNEPLEAAAGGTFTSLACPLCGIECESVQAVLTHMVQRCELRYPQCPLCEGVLTPDDNPYLQRGVSRKASMSKHWRQHVRHVCCKVPCTDCWRQGTWATVQRCARAHAIFTAFCEDAMRTIEALKAMKSGPTAAVAADLFMRVNAWQRQLFCVRPPREMQEELERIGAAPTVAMPLLDSDSDEEPHSSADSGCDSDTETEGDDDETEAERSPLLSPAPVGPDNAEFMRQLLMALSAMGVHAQPHTRPSNPGPPSEHE